MTRIATVLAGALAAVGLSTAPVVAAPPHGPGGHTHHVWTGNGECVDIDSVAFLAEQRGLHRGASASGPGGPGHGACP